MVQFREADARNASRQKRDATATFSFRRKHCPDLVKIKMSIDNRRETFNLIDSQYPQQPTAAHRGLDSRGLIPAQQPRPARQQSVFAEHSREDILAKRPLQPWPRRFPLDQRTRSLHDAPVLDPRWTRRFARAAIQASVDVRDERFRDRQLSL